MTSRQSWTHKLSVAMSQMTNTRMWLATSSHAIETTSSSWRTRHPSQHSNWRKNSQMNTSITCRGVWLQSRSSLTWWTTGWKSISLTSLPIESSPLHPPIRAVPWPRSHRWWLTLPRPALWLTDSAAWSSQARKPSWAWGSSQLCWSHRPRSNCSHQTLVVWGRRKNRPIRGTTRPLRIQSIAHSTWTTIHRAQQLNHQSNWATKSSLITSQWRISGKHTLLQLASIQVSLRSHFLVDPL